MPHNDSVQLVHCPLTDVFITFGTDRNSLNGVSAHPIPLRLMKQLVQRPGANAPIGILPYIMVPG